MIQPDYHTRHFLFPLCLISKKKNKQTKIVMVNIILSNFMMVGCLKLCMYRIKKCIFLNDHF